MRMPILRRLMVLAYLAPGTAWADTPADLTGFERAWHGCVREAYARQPDGRGRTSAQRGALNACRGEEDAYVAAVMAARAEDRPLATRVRAWAASVAASVVDPLTGWIARLRR